jgi:hypothetical protein
VVQYLVEDYCYKKIWKKKCKSRNIGKIYRFKTMNLRERKEEERTIGFGFDFLLKLLGLNISHQIYFLHMAAIHAINGLNGDIIKWREPELPPHSTLRASAMQIKMERKITMHTKY